MPIQVRELDGGAGIEVVATGTVSGAEIIAAHDEIYSDRNLRRQRYQIVDRSHCAAYRVSADEVREIARLDGAAANVNPGIVIAVVSGDDVQFGVSRMWQAYAEAGDFVTQVFRDRAAAERWVQEQLAARAGAP